MNVAVRMLSVLRHAALASLLPSEDNWRNTCIHRVPLKLRYAYGARPNAGETCKNYTKELDEWKQLRHDLGLVGFLNRDDGFVKKLAELLVCTQEIRAAIGIFPHTIPLIQQPGDLEPFP